MKAMEEPAIRLSGHYRKARRHMQLKRRNARRKVWHHRLKRRTGILMQFSNRILRRAPHSSTRSWRRWRVARLVWAACASCVFVAPASAQSVATSRCVDRMALELAQRQSQAPTSDAQSLIETASLQLPELNYTCLRLRNGRHVWVGQAGNMDGPPVLLVHGLGQNAHRDWRASVPALAARFRVIALDLPGFGASDALPQGYSFDALAAVLAEVLEHYRVSRAHVVGHSLGGALSLHFAHVRPQLVDRLVLVDAAGILQRSVFVRHMTLVQLPNYGIAPADRLLSYLDDRVNNLSRLLLRRLDDGFDLSGWLMANPSVRIPLLGRHTQVDAAVGLAEYDFTPAIRAVDAPTTLIWGRDDSIAPLRSGETLVARMRDARMHVLDGVGHVPMSEAARQFNAVLLSALEGPLPPRFNADAPSVQYGDVTCVNESNARFSGHYAVLTLKNCADAHIEYARIGKLILDNSSATLRYSTVSASEGAAVLAERSRLTATAVTVRGRVAIHAVQSEIDLAGASVRASERAVDSHGDSRVYFSVSDIEAPDYSGDAHFIWPPTGRR